MVLFFLDGISQEVTRHQKILIEAEGKGWFLLIYHRCFQFNLIINCYEFIPIIATFFFFYPYVLIVIVKCQWYVGQLPCSESPTL